jgi:hypothetical protein
MTFTAFLKYVKLHAKNITILSVIGLIIILVIISGGKSKQIQQLLLKIKQTKLTNDVAIIQHTISVNNASISGINSSTDQAKTQIAQVVQANTVAQAKIADKQTSINQLADMYNKLNN